MPDYYVLEGWHILVLKRLINSMNTAREWTSGCLQVQALEEKMTAKIMKEARAQNQDLEAEDNIMLQSSRSQQRQVQPRPVLSHR